MGTEKTSNTEKAVSVTKNPGETNSNFVAKEIDINQYIVVRNGFHGRLIYKSARTGEKYVWDGFGSEQEIELKELRNAKNASKNFFVNNWFMFDDDWVIDYLGVRQFYKNAIRVEEFDALFTKSPTELKKAIKSMSNGQRKSVVYRAIELISSGKIDSLKTIAALEEALGVELVEK